MTIKEFSHKHSFIFFWATVISTILLLAMITDIYLKRLDNHRRYPRQCINTQRPMINSRIL